MKPQMNTNVHKLIPFYLCLSVFICGLFAFMTAQTTGPILSFTATTANVAGAPDAIRIDILRWSTGEERDQFLTAWTNPGATSGRGAKGRAAPPPEDPFGAGNDPQSSTAPRGGGRAGRGAAAATPAPRPPEASLTSAIGRAPAVGRLWSSETAGYSLRYAAKLAAQDGAERIILITDRRLGVWNDLWKPVTPAAAATYEFSVIELRLNPHGEGEGKISLTGQVAGDSAAKAIILENYDALPVILKNVRRRTP